jgi:hypothetical protein
MFSAVFGALPAILDAIEYVRYANAPGTTFVSRWALLLLLLSALQIAYGIYLMQVPDWSTVGVVTICLLATAGCYAVVFGLVLIARPTGWLVGPNGLQFADKLPNGQAALWCLCLISVQTTLAFFAGRLFIHWRHSPSPSGRGGHHAQRGR